MFCVWVRLQVHGDQVEAFERAIAANATATIANEPGCVYFDVVKLDEPGNWFGFYEVYRDADAFYVEHRSAPHYSDWQQAVRQTVVPGTQTIAVGERTAASQGTGVQ
jgi:autoinducer 2-degrading protein